MKNEYLNCDGKHRTAIHAERSTHSCGHDRRPDGGGRGLGWRCGRKYPRLPIFPRACGRGGGRRSRNEANFAVGEKAPPRHREHGEMYKCILEKGLRGSLCVLCVSVVKDGGVCGKRSQFGPAVPGNAESEARNPKQIRNAKDQNKPEYAKRTQFQCWAGSTMEPPRGQIRT